MVELAGQEDQKEKEEDKQIVVRILKLIRTALIIAIITIGVITVINITWYYQNVVTKKSDPLQEAYEYQNGAFSMHRYNTGYRSYKIVREPELYINLHVYRKHQMFIMKDLTMEDIEDYLTNEFNEDGKPAVEHKPIAIALYIDYYWYQGGRQEIINYWKKIWDAQNELESTHSIKIKSPTDMTVEQLEVLLKYVDDPECEIDCEVLQ